MIKHYFQNIKNENEEENYDENKNIILKIFQQKKK